jgi:hypothetical protein
MLGTIRPGFHLHATYAEAAAEVASILAKEAAAAARGLPTIDEEDDNSDEEEDEEDAAQGSRQQQGSREEAGSKEEVGLEELDEYDRGEAAVSREDDDFEREFQALMAVSRRASNGVRVGRAEWGGGLGKKGSAGTGLFRAPAVGERRASCMQGHKSNTHGCPGS